MSHSTTVSAFSLYLNDESSTLSVTTKYGSLAQLVERWCYIPDVVGSNPTSPTNLDSCHAEPDVKPDYVTGRSYKNSVHQYAGIEEWLSSLLS